MDVDIDHPGERIFLGEGSHDGAKNKKKGQQSFHYHHLRILDFDAIERRKDTLMWPASMVAGVGGTAFDPQTHILYINANDVGLTESLV